MDLGSDISKAAMLPKTLNTCYYTIVSTIAKYSRVTSIYLVSLLKTENIY